MKSSSAQFISSELDIAIFTPGGVFPPPCGHRSYRRERRSRCCRYRHGACFWAQGIHFLPESCYARQQAVYSCY